MSAQITQNTTDLVTILIKINSLNNYGSSDISAVIEHDVLVVTRT